MDGMLGKDKGHPIKKVNDLEKKMKRLQMYNENPPCELVKERLNSDKNQLTDSTTDLDEDNNTVGGGEQQDISSDSVSDNDMEPPSVLINVLVMDKIFGYLDVKQLKQCRLICKNWDEAVSSILSQRNNGNGLGVNLTIQKFIKADTWNGRFHGVYDLKAYDLRRTPEIHSIIQAAPEYWFTIVNLDDGPWVGDAFKSVFQDFGNRLKVIKFTSRNLRFQTLQSILLDWCQNLEELGLTDITFEADRELQISRPLKLTTLSFNVSEFYESNQSLDVAEILFKIIKNSPNLMKLESLGSSTTVAKQIFTNLQNYPQIMNKMKELFLRNAPLRAVVENGQDALEALANMHFESKLKTLVLTDIKPGQSIALKRILNMTNESLEKLTVISVTSPYLPPSVENLDFQLKPMSCLREFRYLESRQGLMNLPPIPSMLNCPILQC